MLKAVDQELLRFREDVLAGLSAPKPAIPARWLYDKRGSELFDKIARLPSYYPTRTEAALLSEIAPALATLVPDGLAVVEFGAGSATKTPTLLGAVNPAAYVPVDISGEYLAESVYGLAAKFPDLPIFPLAADFTQNFKLPVEVRSKAKLGFFPGSTIGNFVPFSATNLLRHFRRLLGTGSMMLIGMDTIKPVDRLIAAYDDPEGVTAEFNLNLLHRINRDLNGNIPVDGFRHEARWNEAHRRIEMHLVATRHVTFEAHGTCFTFGEGTSIHTENSHKYDECGGFVLLQTGGWTPLAEWTHGSGDFSLILAVAELERSAP